MAIAAALLALFLVYRVRQDVGYAVSSAAPLDLGDARALAARPHGTLPLNRYVRLAGAPDRESAVILDTQGSWTFTQFFRLLGTGNGLFVRRLADPLPVARAERDVFEGRLVPLRTLSFDASIRRHFANHVSATHVFLPGALAAALASGQRPLVVTDAAGEAVTLGPDDTLLLDVARPGEVRIEVTGERPPTLDAVKSHVEAVGGAVVAIDRPLPVDAPGRPGLVARFPEGGPGRDRALSALGDWNRLLRLRPARDTRSVKVAGLSSTPQGLVLAAPRGETGTAALPWTSLVDARTVAPVEIPADAVLLIEGDRPRDHFKTLAIVVVLAVFALLNLLAVRRTA